MDQENSVSTSGDGPSMKIASPVKYMNDTRSALQDASLVSNMSGGGALQQLSNFLNMHAKGSALKEFREVLSVIGGGFIGTSPTIPINDLRGDDAARYPREERLLRCQLAAMCRLIDLKGWTPSIYNHISAKCSSGEFLINPFGLLYHEVQASTLVKVNEHGRIVDSGSTVLGVNKAGWGLHSAVHSTRQDINCVVQIHLPDVVAVTCIKQGLLPVSREAAELLPSTRYHDYVGMVTDEAQAESIRTSLGAGKLLFLRNKGVTVAATSVPEAWYLMKRVISACQIQMRLLQHGGAASLLNELSATAAVEPAQTISDKVETDDDASPSPEFTEDEHVPDQHCNGGVGAKSTSSGVTEMSIWGVGEMEFEAQMRMLDSAGYRTGYTYRNPNLLRRQPVEMPWTASSTGNTTQRNQTMTGDFSGATGFLSDATDVDEITAANSAGATQLARIADSVKSNKEHGNQRNQFLSMTRTGNKPHGGVSEIDIDEPRTPQTPRNELVSRSASLPAHAKNRVKLSARSTNTLEPLDGAEFDEDDDEENKLKGEEKKSKSKWGSFRFPTFKKKIRQPFESATSPTAV